MPRLLFVTLSNIGDLVMTTPALVALHEAFPEAVIDVVADRRSSELLRHAPFLGTLFHRDKREGLPGILRLLGALFRQHYEAVVDLRTDWLPWLLRTRHRSSRLITGATGEHSTTQHFAVVAPLLPRDTVMPAARVWTDPQSELAARNLLAPLGERILAVAPGANWAGKCWAASSFAATAAALRETFDSLVVLGSAADAGAAAELMARSNMPSLDLCGRTSLLEAAAVLRRCSVFLGNDSGLGHIAAAVGIPTVTVFGPGKPARYRPFGPRSEIVCAKNQDLGALAPWPVVEAIQRLSAG